jgi:hypothetical protein
VAANGIGCQPHAGSPLQFLLVTIGEMHHRQPTHVALPFTAEFMKGARELRVPLRGSANRKIMRHRRWRHDLDNAVDSIRFLADDDFISPEQQKIAEDEAV